MGAHSAWEPHRAKAFERLSTKDELRRPTDDVMDRRPQLKEALRAVVDQFKVVCRSAPRICRMRRQIRYVAWHMEAGCRLTNCQSGQERWEIALPARCGRSLPEDAATLAGSPVAGQRARVTREGDRARHIMSIASSVFVLQVGSAAVTGCSVRLVPVRCSAR